MGAVFDIVIFDPVIFDVADNTGTALDQGYVVASDKPRQGTVKVED